MVAELMLNVIKWDTKSVYGSPLESDYYEKIAINIVDIPEQIQDDDQNEWETVQLATHWRLFSVNLLSGPTRSSNEYD